MQAKQVAASIAFSIATLSGATFAGPLDGSEIKALAYVAVPFGGASASQRAPVLGFAVDHVRREAAGLFGISGFMTPLQSARTSGPCSTCASTPGRRAGSASASAVWTP